MHPKISQAPQPQHIQKKYTIGLLKIFIYSHIPHLCKWHFHLSAQSLKPKTWVILQICPFSQLTQTVHHNLYRLHPSGKSRVHPLFISTRAGCVLAPSRPAPPPHATTVAWVVFRPPFPAFGPAKFVYIITEKKYILRSAYYFSYYWTTKSPKGTPKYHVLIFGLRPFWIAA